MPTGSGTTAQPVTLALIAERAGVHVSTVSRALRSPRSTNPRAKTREILAIAEELGYQPNLMASALRLQRTKAIGILVPRLTDYVLARIYEGIDEQASKLGWTTYVANTVDDPDLRLQRLEEFLARRPEGMILGDARLQGDDVLRELKRRAIPHVLTSRRVHGHLSVTTDDLAGGKLAGQHIAEQGHTTVGIIAGEPYASTGTERTQGFIEAFTTKGHGDEPLTVESRFDADGGYRAAQEILTRQPSTTAIFACNDTAAIGAMGAVRDSGRRTGHDIAVVGYNDVPFVRMLPVPMTSVISPMHEMGQAAADALIRRINGESVRSRRLTPHLSIRESTLLYGN